MNNLRVSTIEKAVNSKLRNPYINLYKGEGYWYFVYDDANGDIYEHHTVCVYRLNELTLDQWIEEGNDFVKEIENA